MSTNVLILFLAGTMSQSSATTSYSYGIQMDAGSSGTRIYVFRWTARVFASLPPSMTQVTNPASKGQEWQKKQKPGISHFASNWTGAGENVVPLLDYAKDILAGEGVTDLSTVPLFLGATAGMRMLPPPAVTGILASVRAAVRRAGFMLESDWIRVLSGEEEGQSEWLVCVAVILLLCGPHRNSLFCLVAAHPTVLLVSHRG